MIEVRTFVEFSREHRAGFSEYKFHIQTVKPPVDLTANHVYDLEVGGQCVMHYLDWELPRVYYRLVIANVLKESFGSPAGG